MLQINSKPYMKKIVQAKIVRDGWSCYNGKFIVFWVIRFRFECEKEFNGSSIQYISQRSAYRDLKRHRKGLKRFIPCVPLASNPIEWFCSQRR